MTDKETLELYKKALERIASGHIADGASLILVRIAKDALEQTKR